MEGGELLRLSPISHASDCLCGETRARARAHSRGHSHTLARTGRSAECSDPLGHTRLCGRSVLIPATSEAVC